MMFESKTVVVTGGASGIGAALVAQFLSHGARVVIFDLNVTAGQREDGCRLVSCDVTDEAALKSAISTVEDQVGSIDIFVSNAGVLSNQPGDVGSASDADWARCFAVNLMSHVYAARCLVPLMKARGSGYFVNVASAAGLLNQIGDAAYSASKHAAVSFAESLAITHEKDGIGVTLVCPQYVATPLLKLDDSAAEDHQTLLTAAEVATCILDAVQQSRFLALPHPAVGDYAQSRALDHDRWIKGMQKLRRQAEAEFGTANPEQMYKLV